MFKKDQKWKTDIEEPMSFPMHDIVPKTKAVFTSLYHPTPTLKCSHTRDG